MTFRRFRSLGTGLLLILSAVGGTFADASWRSATRQPVAVVNGTPISQEDFERTYVGFLIATGRNDTPRHRYLHLDNLIDTYLLAEEARRLGMDHEPVFRHVEERVRRKAVGGRFYEEAFLESLAPLTDAEIREAYARSTQQVVVRHLYYRDARTAQAAYARLEAGRGFLDEAQDCYDLAAYDSLAGYLGPIRYFQVDDAFAEAAFALEVGTYSPPVRSRFGYHIIYAEDRLLNPLLAESAYQTHKRGIASQLRLRRMRLEGDRWVRSFMEGRDVQVDTDGLQALALAIRDLERSIVPEPVTVGREDEAPGVDAGALRAALTPQTPLAAYALEGQERVFTAGDYYFWLEELPFEEARHRTAASVGRALRNEVLALAGAARGLDADEGVQREVERESRRHLAAALRARLREAPPATPDEALLRETYHRLGLDRRQRWRADFWVATFEGHALAQDAQRALLEEALRPEDLAGYVAYAKQPLDEMPVWQRHVQHVPLGRTVLVGLRGGTWALLHVTDRRVEAPSFEAYRAQLVEQVAPLMNEYQVLEGLRREATVEVDTVRFEQMMALE